MTNTERDDVGLVQAGYDLVHAVRFRSPTLEEIWRQHASGGNYPEEFGHISFLTLVDAQRIATQLRVGTGDLVVDVGCGTAGPALWIAQQTGARVRGIDLSPAAIDVASARARDLGLDNSASFAVATFDDTGLGDAEVDAAMSIDALQYAPLKRAALVEVARILRPGGTFAFTSFELNVQEMQGEPVYGMDPVSDYRPLLDEAGFDVDDYEETAGWQARVSATYDAVVAAADVLTKEMGEAAYEVMRSDFSFIAERKPFKRRIFAAATRR